MLPVKTSFWQITIWGKRNLDTKLVKNLYLELSKLENRGITIWLDGNPSNSKTVTSQLCFHEDTDYMRDYIFDEGVLKELHFDKIRKEKEIHSKKKSG